MGRGGAGERERETDRQTDRQTERQTERDGERQGDTDIDRHRQTEPETKACVPIRQISVDCQPRADHCRCHALVSAGNATPLDGIIAPSSVGPLVPAQDGARSWRVAGSHCATNYVAALARQWRFAGHWWGWRRRRRLAAWLSCAAILTSRDKSKRITIRNTEIRARVGEKQNCMHSS